MRKTRTHLSVGTGLLKHSANRRREQTVSRSFFLVFYFVVIFILGVIIISSVLIGREVFEVNAAAQFIFRSKHVDIYHKCLNF